MRKLILFIAFLVSLIFGCRDKEGGEGSLVITPELTEDFSLEVDTVKLMTPGTSPAFPYLVWSQDYSDRGLFTGLDMKQHTLYFLDTKKMEYQSSLKLYEDGPNEITPNMVGGIYYHNPDSIFVLQNTPNRLIMVNGEGERELFIELKDAFKEDSVFNGLNAYAVFHYNGIYYHDDKLYFALIREDHTRRDFQYPVIGYYDLIDETYHALDIQFPEEMKKDWEGYNPLPHIRFFRDKILINYGYSADLYLYDLNGDLYQKVNNNSFPTSGPYNEAKYKSRREYYNSNPMYSIALPVLNGKYFIQQGTKPQLDTSKNKDGFIIIYNANFSKYQVFPNNGRPFTFGGEYFYYPIPQEETGYQLLERYKVVE
ncbi:DUF4221 family protein [Membranihabitans maritimus]|uniref:DUF4221 family protein n=1 Tax=Membranihabitans maritimus TaxID=2904244 RepID=UPI001F2986AA|nr:DUF4221 family protein [Membranihabitans maritimus]